MIKLEDNFTSGPEFHYEIIENDNKTFTLKIMNVLAYDTDINTIRKCNIIIPNYEPCDEKILAADDSDIIFNLDFCGGENG